ncbi:MAG: hypothetical protein D6732_12785 [Methanobacteriota archaeon]|nr:MAG: hypothetical protein D6732_12785 [Euryarchaeota archaeon]
MDLLNGIGILFYIFPFLLAGALVNLIQLLLVLRRFSSFAILRILLGYVLLSIWVVLSVVVVILHEENIIMLQTSAPYVTLLFIMTIQTLILANYPLTPRPFRLTNFALAFGWILFGLALAQLVFPQATFVVPKTVNGAYSPKVHPLFIILSAFRGAIFLYLLLGTALRIALNNDKNPLVSISGFLTALVGFILVFAPNLIQNTTISLYLYLFGRFMIITGITIFLEKIRKDPVNQLGAILGINLFFQKQFVQFALFGYGAKGVQVMFHSKFPFYSNEDEKYENILSLGMAGITALGRGEEYIEGSAILPIISPFQMTGLVMTAWINDPQQTDPRLMGRTYLALIVLIDRQFDFLFRNRKHWERQFKKFLEKQKSLARIFPENTMMFTKKTLIEAAITLPRYP